ncbi:carboxypeptidase regulatory-like domain-containing protein [uncultured Gimesia sp.]|uniref:carboxypeptidase regulatory-like domain-containing protein n=1 Tax=uncultured Gimesia sp. TaxID=1678688 RepID=UPI0030DA6BB6|tara:strand:- start:16061 stop:20401 length:4341 start_codon:yes stop_codon:yes gene_type:complete
MTESLNELIKLLNHYGELFWSFSTVMFAQVCVLVIILLLVDLCLRNRVRAVTRYWLWSLVLLKLVLPVTLYSPVSAAYWLADYIPAASTVESATSVVNFEPTETFKSELTASKSVLTDRPLVPDTVPHLKPVPATLPATASEVTPVPQLPIVEVQKAMPVPLLSLKPVAMLLMIWLSVVVVLCIYVLRRTRQVRQLTRQAVAAPLELVNLMHDCCRLIGLKQDVVELKISDQIGSPAICGLGKPTIVLPRHLLDQLDQEQFRQVFVHELAHWKRYDLQLNCLQTLLLILYFYNPMVWVAHTILRGLREQAVDETVLVTLNVQSEQYSSTLLDIAALTPFPDKVSLQLIGILEPRKPLVQRIRRIISRPVPRSAKLGIAGFTTIVLAGILLLPMSRMDRSHAAVEPEVKQDKATIATTEQEPNQKTESSSQPKSAVKEAPAPQGILSGRIVDKTGAPVTDAEVTLLHQLGGRLIRAKTDQDGRYQFSKIPKPGEHRIMIKSQRWVGIERSSDCPRVTLTADSNTVQDITLERACQLRIDALNEEGKPVAGVRIYAKLLTDTSGFSPETVSTDRYGQATLGLKPSKFKYIIATSSPNYGFEKVVIKLDDPNKITSPLFVLQKGVSVTGKVLCSDGKPPAGWKINALPDWWKFGRYPSGYKIGKDGSFTLPHIVSEKYNVSVSVPSGSQTYTNKVVLNSTNFLTLDQPLALKLDYPSPESLVSLSGQIQYSGDGQPQRGFWIFAKSDDPQRSGSVYVMPGKTEFRLDPIQRGKYKLKIQSPGLELKGGEYTVLAPAKDIKLDVVTKGKPKLHGTVVRGDTAQPVNQYQVRAIKIRTLRGPNFVQSSRWLDVDNAKGKFEVEVNGPGIYMVQVAVPGFARALSEQINTDTNQGKPIQVKLTEGVTLAGTVVDEKGQPVEGATVIPLSKSRGVMPPTLGAFTKEDGAAKTVDGKFTLKHLGSGKESLKVTHPDYAFAILKEIDLDSSPVRDVIITLKRGGTVQGLVTDAAGSPESNVTLFFQDRSGYSGNAAKQAGLLATVITDEKGEYSVSHLPEELCYVNRVDEWNSNGVVRQAILPENGKTSTLNLGGLPELTGRLKVNGAPLANRKLLLAGESPNFGIFRATTETDNDGVFSFYGAGPAERTLYYAVPERPNDWVRVNSFQLLSEDQDLGTIDQKIGQLTVKCTPAATENMRLKLQTYNPVWTYGLDTGILKPRSNDSDPFVFTQVPTGEYELVANRPGYPTVFQKVIITPDNLNASVTLALPEGTATLRGSLSKELFGPGNAIWIKLWSEDKRLMSRVFPDEQGRFTVNHLPAGDYFLTEQDVRDSKKSFQFTLKKNEEKTLKLTPELIKKPSSKLGFRIIKVLTENGIPLPGCEIQLQSTTGTISRHSQQDERQHFVGDPGMYDLTAAYPGYETRHQKVELITSGADDRYPDDVTLIVRLKPVSQ